MERTKHLKTIIFYIVLLAFLIAVSLVSTNFDFDLWARLIAGMGFVQSGHVLKADFLSYSPTHIWFDHEWGSGVVFYLAQHYLSYVGIFLLQVSMTFGIFFTITRIVNLRGVKTTTAYNFLFYFFTYHAISKIIDQPVRCQLFSFLLFAIFLYILERARQNHNKTLILLPFLMIIWNNLHGGCVSGIGLICIYAFGEFLNKKPFKKYIYALIPTILVLPINPWGLDYIKFLLFATTMKRPDVAEWQSLIFFSKHYHKFEMFLGAAFLVEFFTVCKNISYKNLDKTKFLVLAVTMFLAFQHVKLLPFFGISAACFVYDDFYTLYNNFMAWIKKAIHLPEKSFGEGFSRNKVISIYCIILFSAACTLYRPGIRPYFNSTRYPLREVEFIRINNLQGKMFTNFGFGSYAAYKLYPNIRIFMDGRYEEVYPVQYVDYMKQFFNMETKNPIVMQKYQPDIFLLEKIYPAYDFIARNKDWKIIFETKAFGVFVKADKAKSYYLQPSNSLQYYKQHAFDTSINFKKSS